MHLFRSLYGVLDRFFAVAVDYAWGMPLLVLLVGGGLLLMLYSRLLPFVGMRHAIDIVRGRYDDPDDPGEISHFQALSTALSSTIGMGNIGGVAIAITQGGPGAVLWMWVAALVGMATKFFTCTLAIMYRGEDSSGQVQGGPMYFLEHGLGRLGKPLALMFATCGMVGCLAMFQSNQMAEAVAEVIDPGKAHIHAIHHATGAVCVLLTAVVILGGVKRIARVASRLVPAMCVLYVGSALLIIGLHIDQVPAVFARIVGDAFGSRAVVGGAAGYAFMTVVQVGVRRAAFSNEAGIGTAPMAHGAAKTTEPVREGLVAMVGPFIDTIVICSMTAFVILVSGAWQGGGKVTGVGLTIAAYDNLLGGWSSFVLLLVILMFGLSTVFGYSYYGRKCFSYLFGAERGRYYAYVYIASLYFGAIWSANLVVNLLDTAFALMAFPTMVGTILMSPRVMRATRSYFRRMRDQALEQGAAAR